MKLIGLRKIENFKKKHPDSSKTTAALIDELRQATWVKPHDIKAKFPKSSIIGNKNVILDICHNNYRLWLKVNYDAGVILLKEIGTHKEYMKWKII